jgi:hypothetical protein
VAADGGCVCVCVCVCVFECLCVSVCLPCEVVIAEGCLWLCARLHVTAFRFTYTASSSDAQVVTTDDSIGGYSMCMHVV